MKMFKKLMAVVLTGALAASMLTGCALGDKVKENALLKALEYEGKKETPIVKYEEGTKANDTAKTNLSAEMTKAKKAVKDAAETNTAAQVETVYVASKEFVVIVKEMPNKANKKDSWSAIADAAHDELNSYAHKGGSKNDTIVVDIDFVNDKKVAKAGSTGTEKTDFVIIVAAK